MPKEITFPSFEDPIRKKLESLLLVLTIKNKKLEKNPPSESLLKEQFQKDPNLIKLKSLVENFLNEESDSAPKIDEILALIKEIRVSDKEKNKNLKLHAALADICKEPTPASMYIFFSTLNFYKTSKQHLEDFESIILKLLHTQKNFSTKFNFKILVFTSYEEVFKEKDYSEEQIEFMQKEIFAKLQNVAIRILGEDDCNEKIHWSKPYRDQVSSFSLKSKIAEKDHASFDDNVHSFLVNFATRAFGVSPFNKHQRSIDPKNYEGRKKNILIGSLTELEILYLFTKQTMLGENPSEGSSPCNFYFAHIGAMKQVATIFKMVYPEKHISFVNIQVNGKSDYVAPKKPAKELPKKQDEKTRDSYKLILNSSDPWASVTSLGAKSPQCGEALASVMPLEVTAPKKQEEKTRLILHSSDPWASVTPLGAKSPQCGDALASGIPLEVTAPQKPCRPTSAPSRFFSRSHGNNHTATKNPPSKKSAKIIENYELIPTNGR